MRMRWALWLIGALLSIAATMVVLSQVEVTAASSARSCGTPFDVITGRVGWQQWWSADLSDADAAGGLVRTRRCPGAENRRLAVAGVLAGAAMTAVGAGGWIARGPVGMPGRVSPSARLRRLGRWVTWGGVVLGAAGVAGLGLLLADPESTLFVYVTRPTVALVGVLALLPAVALVVIGRALDVLGCSLDREEADVPA